VRRLAGSRELLDGPLDDRPALIGNLRDLRRVNRFFGGTALSQSAVDVLITGRRDGFSLLDVGTGAADIPVALLRAEAARGRDMRVVALDTRGEILEAARQLDPGLGDHRDLQLATADGRELPYQANSFDLVHSSLVMHHLEPQDAIAFLREGRRVARKGVVINDLVRGRAQWAAVWLLTRLFTRNRFTRHDAPMSVQRAYTRMELRALLAAAGLQPVAEFVGPLRHRVAIAAVAIPDA
jgi:ubiquinone/menaquinone biosynthesis C-methylase UbiE